MRTVLRPPQLRAPFTPGAPSGGYYNDLTIKATETGSPAGGVRLARELTASRERANPVTVAQLGLGAWQLSRDAPEWLETVEIVTAWLEGALEGDGRVPYRFGMPHTFALTPPWSSAMGQGEIASLFVRAAGSLGRPELEKAAVAAIAPLVDPTSDLVATTPAGPVLQEYPTTPPAHVLNGWIFALWGLYDVATTGDGPAEAAWTEGIRALAARLPAYGTYGDWSRYDLYPHRLVHVTSPFYHRLHIEQLRALDELTPHAVFRNTADRWERGLQNPVKKCLAVARKATFRLLEPRRGEV